MACAILPPNDAGAVPTVGKWTRTVDPLLNGPAASFERRRGSREGIFKCST